MLNVLAFYCHLNTGQPNHLNTEQLDAILFSYVLVWYSNGRSRKWDISNGCHSDQLTDSRTLTEEKYVKGLSCPSLSKIIEPTRKLGETI